ncbi:MAG: pyridoxal-phosphate dependent enzyme [Cocleimonas sp.]|nr:pyridoxal-phosphate dependent enzyme [Cocleimonas sp.]
MVLTIQEIHTQITSKAGVSLSVARADLIHPLVSGNKIYKLLPNIKYAKANGYNELLSFGGAFSNHIHALAHMANQHSLKSIGIIRGEKEYATNPTLQDARKAGMHLEFVTRENYQRRNEVDYLAELQQRYPKALIVPEGGSSQQAITGCAQLAQHINNDEAQAFDTLTVACGTGATLAGLVCGAPQQQSLIGYAVLRDESLVGRVEDFINNEKGTIFSSYTIEAADFGGYAKFDKPLLDFILEWLEQTGILLDPIYTSKMCMRLMQQIEAGEFEAGTSICMIHSGGLQGWRGMKNRVIKLAGDNPWEKIETVLQASIM